MRSCGAPGEEAAALAMLEITVSIFSAKGRAASAAVCARRSLEAATICMALVIFCVALVEAMRTRMSLSDAILRSPRRSASGWTATRSHRHARACPGHPRLRLHAVTHGWPGQGPGHDGSYYAKL